MTRFLDFEILGGDLQVVEVVLAPGDTVVAEAGAMVYMEEGVSFQAKLGDGSSEFGFFGNLLGAAKRTVSGAGAFLAHFTNEYVGKRKIAFSASYPGKIVALNLAEFGGSLHCQKEAFLCASSGVRIDISFTKRLGAGLFGGAGFVLQRIEGEGIVFLHAGGMVVRKELRGQSLFVDTGSVVAFSSGVDFNIKRSGDLPSMLFGGEGIFLAALSGTGSIFLQSLPGYKLAARLLAMGNSKTS